MITVNLYYTGSGGNARAFAEEMESSGIADKIRQEDGNLRYQYFQPLNQPETVLLIDSWRDQKAIDAHHASPMMAQLAALREKYDLHMTVERFISTNLRSKNIQISDRKTIKYPIYMLFEELRQTVTEMHREHRLSNMVNFRARNLKI